LDAILNLRGVFVTLCRIGIIYRQKRQVANRFYRKLFLDVEERGKRGFLCTEQGIYFRETTKAEQLRFFYSLISVNPRSSASVKRGLTYYR